MNAPVTGNVICGSLAAACVCGLTPGHEGPHECARPSCAGSWRGEMDGDDFEVIRFPDISSLLGGDL